MNITQKELAKHFARKLRKNQTKSELGLKIIRFVNNEIESNFESIKKQLLDFLAISKIANN